MHDDHPLLTKLTAVPVRLNQRKAIELLCSEQEGIREALLEAYFRRGVSAEELTDTVNEYAITEIDRNGMYRWLNANRPAWADGRGGSTTTSREPLDLEIR